MLEQEPRSAPPVRQDTILQQNWRIIALLVRLENSRVPPGVAVATHAPLDPTRMRREQHNVRPAVQENMRHRPELSRAQRAGSERTHRTTLFASPVQSGKAPTRQEIRVASRVMLEPTPQQQ